MSMVSDLDFYVAASNTAVHPTLRKRYCFFYLNKDRSCIIGKWTRLWICCLDADQFDVCQLLHFTILKRDIICIMYIAEMIWAYYTLHGSAFIIIIPTSMCSTDSHAARQFLMEFFIMPHIPKILTISFFFFLNLQKFTESTVISIIC